MQKKVLLIGRNNSLLPILSNYEVEVISSVSFLDSVLFNFLPDLIIFDSLLGISVNDIRLVRREKRICTALILIIFDSCLGEGIITAISQFPRILLCHEIIAKTPNFLNKLNLILNKSEKTLLPKSSFSVKKAIFYIHTHFSSQFTREDVAIFCGISEDYLSRIFRKELGIVLWDYVILLRLQKARTQLLESNSTVSEIAKECGFSSDEYFNRMFHRHYKISPGSLRKGLAP